MYDFYIFLTLMIIYGIWRVYYAYKTEKIDTKIKQLEKQKEELEKHIKN